MCAECNWKPRVEELSHTMQRYWRLLLAPFGGRLHKMTPASMAQFQVLSDIWLKIGREKHITGDEVTTVDEIEASIVAARLLEME